MRLFPPSVEEWLPEERVARIAFKVMIVNLYLAFMGGLVFVIFKAVSLAAG